MNLHDFMQPVVQGGAQEVQAEAAAWLQAAQAWRERMQQRFSVYKDVLGPMVLGLHEVSRGLQLLLGSVEQGAQQAELAVHLMSYPPAPGAPAHGWRLDHTRIGFA